jgi:hypothetical protein
MKREYSHLQMSWIKKAELEELGYGKIIRSYDNFMETLKNDSKNRSKFKDEEIKRISKPKYLQMELDRAQYGQPQSVQPRIYAPIYEIKN